MHHVFLPRRVGTCRSSVLTPCGLALAVILAAAGCDAPRTAADSASAGTAGAESEGTVAVTDASFDAEVLKAKGPVLVDFWAPWCGPCLRLAPTIAELARDYRGKVKIGKLNTDENQKSAAVYQIQGIPCVLLFRDGKVVERVVGLNPKSTYTQLLDRQLAGR